MISAVQCDIALKDVPERLVVIFTKPTSETPPLILVICSLDESKYLPELLNKDPQNVVQIAI